MRQIDDKRGLDVNEAQPLPIHFISTNTAQCNLVIKFVSFSFCLINRSFLLLE